MTGGNIRWFVAIAVVVAAVCVRLGIWQLDRLDQRRARNALVVERLKSPPEDPRNLPRDTAAVRFRRARVVGTPDYSHELVFAARTRNGSPGVNFLTPVRLPGIDTAVLVNRGWVYSPDGSTVDSLRWRERDSVFTGFVEPLPPGPGAAYVNRPNVIARLSYDVVATALPYPVFPFVVTAVDAGDTTDTANRIARLTAPALDEGPHFGYAMQWFGFATVALVGAGVVIRQSRRGGGRRDDRDVPGGANAPD